MDSWPLIRVTARGAIPENDQPMLLCPGPLVNQLFKAHELVAGLLT